MANLEPCFRSQILCGRYFNLPCTLLHQFGYAFSMCTHTHTVSQFSVMISWCSVHARWQERKKCHNKAIQQLQNCLHPKENTFSPQRGKNWGWYLSCTAVKIQKGNASFFPSWTGWVTDCRGAFTGPHLRRDWRGGRLRGLQLGYRVAMCLSFHWNNTRTMDSIPNKKTKVTEKSQILCLGPSVCGKERQFPKSNYCPIFWLFPFCAPFLTLKGPKLRVRWVRSSTEMDSNISEKICAQCVWEDLWLEQDS